MELDPEPWLVKSRNRNRNHNFFKSRNRNRNHNFSKSEPEPEPYKIVTAPQHWFEKIDTVPVGQHVRLAFAAHEPALGFCNLRLHVDLGTSLKMKMGMIKKGFSHSQPEMEFLDINLRSTWDGILGHQLKSQPETEFLDVNLAKDSSLLLQAIHTVPSTYGF